MIPGLSTVKLIGLAIAVLLVVGLFGWAKIEQANARKWEATAQSYAAQRDQAIGVANDNAAQLRQVTADRDRFRDQAGATAAAFQQHKAAAYIQIAKLKKEVADATAQTECPVAPSVVAALRGLSDAGAAPDGDRGADGKAADPGRSDGAVRRPPAAS
jgi:hypothetical protein